MAQAPTDLLVITIWYLISFIPYMNNW